MLVELPSALRASVMTHDAGDDGRAAEVITNIGALCASIMLHTCLESGSSNIAAERDHPCSTGHTT